MTKIKVKLRPSALQGRPDTLTYQVTHHSRTRQISTCYRIYPEEWDEKHVRLIPFYDERKELLWSFDQRMKQDMEFLRTIVAELESEDAPHETDEVVKRFLAATESPFFLRFMKDVIGRLKKHGQKRTAETYVSAYNSFKHFRNGHDVSVHELTGELLTDYQASLLHHG